MHIVMKNGYLRFSKLTLYLIDAKSVNVIVIDVQIKRCGAAVLFENQTRPARKNNNLDSNNKQTQT